LASGLLDILGVMEAPRKQGYEPANTRKTGESVELFTLGRHDSVEITTYGRGKGTGLRNIPAAGDKPADGDGNQFKRIAVSLTDIMYDPTSGFTETGP
jgi:hypothetical protein